MANTHSTLTSLFSAIANAIRAKTGGTEPIKADQFPEAIEAISTQEDLNAEMTAQDSLIAQITAALDGKTVPSSGGASPNNHFAVQNNLMMGEIYFFPFVNGMTWAEYLESGLIPLVASANSDPYPTVMYDEYMGFMYWFYDPGSDYVSYGNLMSASGWPDLSDVIHGYDEEIYFTE